MTDVQSHKKKLDGEPSIDWPKVVNELPSPERTKYPYELVTIDGLTAYLAGQIPKQNGALAYTGPIGRQVSVQDAVKAARICSQQALAWLNVSAGGLENLRRVLRITCYVAHDETFNDISQVADGASQYLIETLADRGRHARSVIGVHSLPRNAPVLVEMTVALKEPI